MTNTIKNSAILHPGKRNFSGVAMTAALMLPLLAGCQHSRYQENYMVASDYEQRHLIEVVRKPQAIRVRVARDATGLDGYQMSKVRNFLAAYAKNPQGSIIVKAPSGAANENAAIEVLKDLRQLTQEYQIPASALALRPYYAEGRGEPPIRMSFENYVAIPPDCGDWSQNLADDRENVPFPNFGCSTQRNLAVMVANPRDLVKPRGSDPSSRPSDRRDVVHDKFTKGAVSSAKRSNEEKSAVSDVAKGQ